MLVGTVERVFLLVGPPLIGVLADATSLRAALVVMPAGALVVVLLSRTLSGAAR